ncbi:hypothetical protein [Streptomyces sp. NPDC029721]|uniref:hypothetical protein n=1 Tax=Streptomyces sp. NPDC029721 TaxID=3157090 RepID=UPI0033C7469B
MPDTPVPGRARAAVAWPGWVRAADAGLAGAVTRTAVAWRGWCRIGQSGAGAG